MSLCCLLLGGDPQIAGEGKLQSQECSVGDSSPDRREGREQFIRDDEGNAN